MNPPKSDNTPSGAMSDGDLIRAVQYLRMSTEHQKYSTKNQSDVIAEYAKRNGMKVIHTYADEGKSGLKIDGRDGLKRLISDVEGGAGRF